MRTIIAAGLIAIGVFATAAATMTPTKGSEFGVIRQSPRSVVCSARIGIIPFRELFRKAAGGEITEYDDDRIARNCMIMAPGTKVEVMWHIKSEGEEELLHISVPGSSALLLTFAFCVDPI